MLIIPQGKPTAAHFGVFVPETQAVTVGEQVECRHPATGAKTTGTCAFILTAQWLHIPEWICQYCYNVSAIEIKKALEARFEEFRGCDGVKIIIVKETREN